MKQQTIETLKYWRDISECICLETRPIGACLCCDIEEILKSEGLQKHSGSMRTVKINGIDMSVNLTTGAPPGGSIAIFESESFDPENPKFHIPEGVFCKGQQIKCTKECGLEVGKDYLVKNVIASSLGDVVELHGFEGQAFEIHNFA